MSILKEEELISYYIYQFQRLINKYPFNFIIRICLIMFFSREYFSNLDLLFIYI
jgi:hypothetical protein